MPPEGEDSPEAERRGSSQSTFRFPSSSAIQQTQEAVELSPAVRPNSRQSVRQFDLNHPTVSPIRQFHQTDIISPKPRLPSSLSTLLNQAESSRAPPEDSARGRQGSQRPSSKYTTSISPSGRAQPLTSDDRQRSSRSRSPNRPRMTPYRHSFHAPSTSRPAFPPRDTFRTFPLNRSRPSSPSTSAEGYRRRRPEFSLPHLSNIPIGQALALSRHPNLQASPDHRSSPYTTGLGYVQQGHEMHRSSTYPESHSPRRDHHLNSQAIPAEGDPKYTRLSYSGDNQRFEASQKVWVTLSAPSNRDMSTWTPQEVARYEDGYRDAMQAVLEGEALIGGDQRASIKIPDPRSTGYHQSSSFNHPLSSSYIPPPQPPQVMHRRPVRIDNLRIDPPLPSPGTHRRLSYSSSNIATPTGTAPQNIIHPPPTSDYFGTAFHHTRQSPSTPYPPAKRAKRQQISCFPCRERKLKCDGKTPCAQCSKRHIDGQCKYAERIRRRGRGKRVSDEGQGVDESEEHEYEGEEGSQGESSAVAQRRAGRAVDIKEGNVERGQVLVDGASGGDKPERRPSTGHEGAMVDHSGDVEH